MVLLNLYKIQTKGKNCIFWVICFSNTWYRNTPSISYGPSVHHFSRLLHTQEFYNHQTSIIRHFLWPFRGRMGCSSARALGKWEKMGPSSDTNNILVRLLSRNNAKEELNRKLGYKWVYLVPPSLSVNCNLRDAGVEALQIENWSCFSSQTNFLWLSLPFTATLHPEIVEVIISLITHNLLPVDGDVEGAAVLLQLHLLLLHLFLLARLASLVGHQGVGDVDHLWYVASKKGLELEEKKKKKGSFQLARSSRLWIEPLKYRWISWLKIL